MVASVIQRLLVMFYFSQVQPLHVQLLQVQFLQFPNLQPSQLHVQFVFSIISIYLKD